MGRRANPTLIGAFIVGAVTLIVIGLLVFGRSHFFKTLLVTKAAPTTATTSMPLESKLS